MGLTGWSFSICASLIPETSRPGEEPHELATRLALSKAQAARKACPDDTVIFAADTMVIHKGEILGKPANTADAVSMLQNLRGLNHDVITAIVLDVEAQASLIELCESRVPMREYDDDDVLTYVGGGSPFDKAGAYGIQDPDFHPVDIEGFNDCYANVMGLPLCHLVRTFKKLGFDPPNEVPQRCMQFTGYDCTIYPAILRGDL
jgi:MAF protein